MRRFSTIVCLILMLGFLAACRSKPDDQTIVKDIQAKVAADPVTQDSRVAVEAHQGKVTVTGNTRTPAAKQQMMKIVKSEPGVSEINDETSVGQGNFAGSVPGASPVSTTPAAVPAPPPPPPPPPPPTVVPAGTILTVRINQGLSTKTVKTGTAFTGSLMTPITLEGKLIIPDGCDVTGTVIEAKKAGKFKGGAILKLALNSITVKGHKYNIVTEYFGQETKGKGKRTAGMAGGGAGVGAAIGGIAGGGKGAAIGALAGAAAGTAGAMTGNRDIEFPPESALNFKLDQALTLRPGAGE